MLITPHKFTRDPDYPTVTTIFGKGIAKRTYLLENYDRPLFILSTFHKGAIYNYRDQNDLYICDFTDDNIPALESYLKNTNNGTIVVDLMDDIINSYEIIDEDVKDIWYYNKNFHKTHDSVESFLKFVMSFILPVVLLVSESSIDDYNVKVLLPYSTTVLQVEGDNP